MPLNKRTLLISTWRLTQALGLSAVLLTLAFCSLNAAANRSPEIRVILWFDTEDYLSPRDDDATKRLCEMLTDRGIHATFKLVGEKARVLERRGRRDVIAALKKHDIGYHADFHSVHPAPTEYLADCGWLDGIAEFARREGDGAADVRRILEVPTLACYGQPGSSWAPQAMAALKQIGVAPSGIPCYVDEGSHVGLEEKPFWYTGVLTVYHMGANTTRMDLHDPAAVAPAKKKVSDIAERLRSQGGGLISIFYHPCEWIHREFWDGVNFARGRNPPREEWKVPPQRTPEETDVAFERFAEYVDHIRAIPGVRWITASELPGLYPDVTRTQGATKEDLDELARRISKKDAAGLDYQRIGDRVYSIADQFELLTVAVNATMTRQKVLFPLKISALQGPDAPPPGSATLSNVARLVFRDAVHDVEEFVRVTQRVPTRVFIGSEQASPAEFLIAMASVWSANERQPADGRKDEVALGRQARILPERWIAQDTPGLFGGWVIHKENFRAPKVMELARLQAWTLKPATPARSSTQE